MIDLMRLQAFLYAAESLGFSEAARQRAQFLQRPLSDRLAPAGQKNT